MPLSIKHRDADRLARSLAEVTGQSITNAVLMALREQLRRETGRGSASRLKDELKLFRSDARRFPISTYVLRTRLLASMSTEFPGDCRYFRTGQRPFSARMNAMFCWTRLPRTRCA
jgi:antitoxin VapB